MQGLFGLCLMLYLRGCCLLFWFELVLSVVFCLGVLMAGKEFRERATLLKAFYLRQLAEKKKEDNF